MRKTRANARIIVLLLALLPVMAPGLGDAPPAATGTVFTDVPASHPFAVWIEQLSREGITGGCTTSPARYCPDSPLTRGQIAVFLVRTFHLPQQ